MESKSKYPTRKDKARPTLEMLAALVAIFEGDKPPTDYAVLMTIKAWGYLTIGVVTKDHLLGSIPMSEYHITRAINRLRKYGWIAYDEQSGHMNVTKAGIKENFRLQGEMSKTWKRFQEQTVKNRTENLINYRNEKDRPSD